MAMTAVRSLWHRVFQQINTGSATLTAVSPTAGATFAGSGTISVPGAAIGDIVDVSSPAVQPAGIYTYGVVTAVGVVTIYYANVTVGTLAAAAGLYRVATYPFTSEVA